MITKREVTPDDLGLVDLAMDAVALTEYPAGQIQDCRKYFIFQAITQVSGVLGAAGDATLRLDFYAKDKTTLIYQLDAATLLRTHTANDANVILFGAGATAAIFGNGTLGTSLAIAKIIFFMQPVVVVTTQADAASLMSVRLLMEG